MRNGTSLLIFAFTQNFELIFSKIRIYGPASSLRRDVASISDVSRKIRGESVWKSVQDDPQLRDWKSLLSPQV